MLTTGERVKQNLGKIPGGQVLVAGKDILYSKTAWWDCLPHIAPCFLVKLPRRAGSRLSGPQAVVSLKVIIRIRESREEKRK